MPFDPPALPNGSGIASDPIRVLHLDDEPAVTDLTARFLAEVSPEFDVVTENNPERALERVTHDEFECVVSDYEMPGMDGLTFLELVREQDPNLPFILFTGRGSEEIASEAISRGVTDYLQKAVGTDQYTVLANRIRNTVAQYRAEQEIETRSEWYSRILHHSSDYVIIVNPNGEIAYVSPAIERVVGYDPDEVTGTDAFQYVHEDDIEAAAAALAETIEHPDREVTTEFRARTRDGMVRWLEIRGSNFLDDPLINGVMVNVRDITERKHREDAVTRQKEHLQELTSFLSHDVKNQLHVARGYLEHARDERDFEKLDRAVTALERVYQMIVQVERLAKCDDHALDVEAHDLAAAVQGVWATVGDADDRAALEIESDVVVPADGAGLRSLLQNLLVNAIGHAGPDVTVRVGALLDGRGFFVEDDGPGIPPDDRARVFDTDYTSTSEGTGLGLAIVARVAEAHGWTVTATESPHGGARFEFTVAAPDAPGADTAHTGVPNP